MFVLFQSIAEIDYSYFPQFRKKYILFRLLTKSISRCILLCVESNQSEAKSIVYEQYS